MTAHTDNSIVIDAPLGLVWQRTNDVAKWTELFSEYAHVEILDRFGPTVRFRLTMHPDENGIMWSWVSERTADSSAMTTTSLRVETGPFKYMFLFWEYTVVDGGVRLRWVQEFEMKPGAPVDDETMRKRINHNSAIQQERIKQLLEAEAADLVTVSAGTRH
ncbi:MAG TPA: SRPBCC family protein [Pseudonocardiaceae bacterium]